MGSEQRILDKIMDDAKLEVQEIEAQAKQQADMVVKAAQDKSTKETESYKAQAQLQAQKAAEKEISGAQMEAKKKILTKKQELLAQVIQEAHRKLSALDGKDYENTILTMVEKAEKGDCIVLPSKQRKGLSSALKQAGYVVSDTVKEIGGGFIVQKGEIEYNYSFDAIISVEREAIEQMVAQILFN